MTSDSTIFMIWEYPSLTNNHLQLKLINIKALLAPLLEVETFMAQCDDDSSMSDKQDQFVK
jgi:hypothetical protein